MASGHAERNATDEPRYEWLRSAVEHSGDAVGILRPIRNDAGEIIDFNHLYVNPTGSRLADVSVANFVTRSLCDIFPEVRRGLLRHFVDVANTGTLFHLPDLRYRKAFGAQSTTRTLDLVVAPAGGDDICTIWRDVTAEAEAHEDLRRAVTIVDASPNAVLTKTLNGTITSWNPAAQRFYGYTEAEAIGQQVSILEPPERAGEVSLLLRRLRDGEQITHYETVRLTKDGRRLDCALTLIPLRDNAGNVTEIATTALDVTQRRRAEERLRVSRAYNRGLIEASLDGLVAVGPDLVITDVNESLCRLVGQRRTDLIGSFFPEHFTDPARAATGVRKALSEGSVSDYELRLSPAGRDGNDDEVLVSFNAATYTDPSTGEVRGVLAAARDITSRRRAETDVLRLSGQRRDTAEEASRQKSDFLASMSHEIRTPMNGVIGLTGLLLAGELNETQRRYAEGIETAGRALMTIISQVLDIAKIESGRIVLRQEEFDLARLVEDMVDLQTGNASAKGITVGSYLGATVPAAVVGDRARVQQILLNFVDNAVKFTERGGVTIRATMDEQSPPTSPIIRFEIVDTGIGIPAEEIDLLFNRFVQTTSASGGTGLGLAISKQLAELMGGHVGVRSQIGHGSTFWFTAALPTAPGSTTLPTAGPCVDGARVLVVDDRAPVRLPICDYLRDWHAGSTPADSPEIGADLVSGTQPGVEPFDLVIAAQWPPEPGGGPSGGGLPGEGPRRGGPAVLRLAGPAADDNAAESADGEITVPVHRSALLAALDQALSHRVPTPQADTPHADTPNADIPQVEAASPTPSSPVNPTPSEDPGPAPNASPNDGPGVLVVEDNPINQMVVIEMLRRFEQTADVANNGQEALDLAEHHTYDLILMDCLMPVLDGYAATAELRRREAGGAHTPIVALTATAQPQDRDKALAAGMDDYVVKPFTPDDIEQVLRRWVGSDSDNRSPSA